MLCILVLLGIGSLRGEVVDRPDRATAIAEARAGNWERAEAVLAELANATPSDVEACVLLTEHCLKQKRNKEAVDFAEKAAEAVPDNAGLQSLLGRALGARISDLAFIQQGFVAPRMLRAFKRSVELDPNHVPGLFGLASYHLYSPAIAGGDKQKADEFAARAEVLAPFDGAILRAQIRERTERWTEAAEFFGKAAALRPDNAWVQLRIGQNLVKAGATEAARDAFEAALKLQPDYGEAKQALTAMQTAKPD